MNLLPRPKYDNNGCPFLYFTDEREVLGPTIDLLLSDVAEPESPSLRVMFYNLIVSALLSKQELTEVPVLISLDKNSYTRPPAVYPFSVKKMSYRKAKEALQILEGAGLLILKKGSKFSGKLSAITPSSKFLQKLAQLNSFEVRTLIEKGHVLLRSAKDDGPRKLLEFSENELVQDMKYNLRTINDHSVKYQVTYSQKSFIKKRVTLAPSNLRYNRSFIENWEQLGRFYADFQSLRTEERKSIQINGQSTVELDYGSVSISILYHLTQGYLPEEDDLYLLKDIDRAYVKHATVILLNCFSFNQAAPAINGYFSKKPRPPVTPLAKELKDKIFKKHSVISSYFLSGKGLWLQYLDSKIAESILLAFARADKPILAVHDSFITTVDNEDFLREQMTCAYQNVLRELSSKYQNQPPRIKKEKRN